MIKTRNQRIVKIATLVVSLAFFAGVNVTQATVLNSANVVTLINQSRTSAGVSALTVSDKLTAAAQAKADDMFAKQYFAHVGPDGFGPAHWFSLAGYNWTYMGENIAYGHSTAETVHDAFMASPGHKANIMGVNYKNVGIAAVSGTYNGRTTVMVVEEFGTTNTPESTTTYPLTVSGGTGSGSYASGKTVTITAATPATGKVFDQWTGDTSYVSGLNSATTNITMPARAMTLTATYKDSNTALYSLSVKNGTGSGSYLSGKSVAVTASAPAPGKVFDKWTGDTSHITNATSAMITVTMPAKAITLTAVYKDVAYVLTITGGSGSGSYNSDNTVTIVASAPTTGKVFDRWTGDTSYVASATAATTKVNMPAKAIKLTATYKELAATSTYPNGTLFKLSTSSKIYVVMDGKKKWVSIPEVFEQLGYKWTNIKVVTPAELEKYQDYEDNLVRVRGDFKVYLVVNGVRRHIPNPKIFLDYGFNWNDIKDMDSAATGKYKDTMIIKESGKTDVYLLTYGGIKKLIPSTEILKTYDTKAEDIQVVSKTEMESYPACNVIKLKDSKDVYLIEGNTKKHITSPVAFNKHKLDWNSVVDVNETDFNFYQNKGNLD